MATCFLENRDFLKSRSESKHDKQILMLEM